ncbi:MAG: hypothetical protein MUC68_09400 [Burkholderiaceae bacterium]|jgi:putative membrane protein|nr:hypothetical protein [Burkholderiaceae bacterium]
MVPFDGWWHGMPFMWLFPLTFLLVMLVCVGMMTGLFRRTNAEGEPQRRALDVLDERFARGDISKSQYEDMRQTMRR